jgi:hypothetical protein
MALPATGCQPNRSEPDPVLLQVGKRTLTVSEFRESVNSVRAAYEPETWARLGPWRKASLLSEITERMLILERARTLSIEISDSDLQDSLNRLRHPAAGKAELPNDDALTVFQIREMKRRLTVEAVIMRDLAKNLNIRREDVKRFWENRPSPYGELPGANPESVLSALRRDKLETAYNAWINKLMKTYPITVDKQLWETEIGINPILTDR